LRHPKDGIASYNKRDRRRIDQVAGAFAMVILSRARLAPFLGLLLSLTGFTPLLMSQQGNQPPGGNAPSPRPDEATVLERGPVHEAYAQPNQANPQPAPAVPRQPPESIPEQPPDQKPQGENVQWIPGYWSWDADRKDFIWVSGFWRIPPPDRKWVPGHWAQGDAGWQWVPGFWMANARQDLPVVPQPPESLENGPSVPAPSDDSFYIPGGWLYQDARYFWRPGFWSTGYADWVWVPGCYRWTPAGYYYVDGYWDYPLYNRGLLFAPVWFPRPYWLTRGWFYRPGYVVSLGFDSLFVNPLWGSYYFGNYYAPYYGGLGFYPWYRYGPRFYDPFYAHAFWLHRHDTGWSPGLRSTFLARQALAQRGLVSSPGGRAGAVANAGLPRMVTPLSQFQSRNLGLTNMTGAQLAQQRSNARSFQQVSLRRTRLEGPGGHAGVQPASVFGSLPGSRPAGASSPYQARLASTGQRTAFYAGPSGSSTSLGGFDRRFDAGSFRSGSPRSSGTSEVWSFHEPRYQPGRSLGSFSSPGHSSGTAHLSAPSGGGHINGGHASPHSSAGGAHAGGGGHASGGGHSGGGGHAHGHH
jgi:hypothetical protein